jgi:hypothetical protein
VFSYEQPNKPLHATVPPQGHCSIIERPARAAGPRVNGKAFDGRTCYRLGQMLKVERLRKMKLGLLVVLGVAGGLGLIGVLAMHSEGPRSSVAGGASRSVVETDAKPALSDSPRPPIRPIDWTKGSEPKDCQDADRRFWILFYSHARICQTDEECRHYPGTCSAIGASDAAVELLALQKWLEKRKCKGFGLPFEDCGETKPVCVDHSCVVQKLGEPHPGQTGAQ